jgi:hypothetical protein
MLPVARVSANICNKTSTDICCVLRFLHILIYITILESRRWQVDSKGFRLWSVILRITRFLTSSIALVLQENKEEHNNSETGFDSIIRWHLHCWVRQKELFPITGLLALSGGPYSAGVSHQSPLSVRMVVCVPLEEMQNAVLVSRKTKPSAEYSAFSFGSWGSCSLRSALLSFDHVKIFKGLTAWNFFFR